MFCHENLFKPTNMFLLLIKLYPSVILSDVRVVGQFLKLNH